MKRSQLWSGSLLAWAALMASGSIAAQGRSAGVDRSGGRDLRVALFSTTTLRSVTLTPLGAATWVAECARCAHRPLTVPMPFAGPGEIFAGGALRVTDAATGDQRSASGAWHLKAVAGAVDVVLTMPSERYVAAVLSAEADAGEPVASLEALAVVARTYALNGSHFAAAEGHLKAELCDSTACQAMRLGTVSDPVEQAVWETAGETLWFGRQRAELYFSQNCGGVTEDVHAAWPAMHPLPYLATHADPYCVRRGGSAWHAEVSLGELRSLASRQGWRLPAEIVSVEVVQRSASHRALLLAFDGSDGVRATVSASALRFAIGRALGWNRVRSDWYDVGVRNGALIFDGRGFGHGVGLCQAGATEMALEHKSTREILSFYLPGTRLGIGPDDAGWVMDDIAGVTVRSLSWMPGGLPPDRRRAVEAAWAQAKTLFPPRARVAPELVFAPSVELFRQMTGQPGWMLASTRGTRMVLQPTSVLATREEKTLLHEMLHVLVESEASAKAPLWLREGLVEVLAGDAGAGTMSDAAIEAALRHAQSRDMSARAHRAAALRVQELIARDGVAQVRSWLGAGLPFGTE